ncbi:RsmB/NOP family class I SAM-dependent RNA methyltransferase [Paenibacillus sp. FSL W8-0426]|uniref:RsmB/NOP family class I SAM-dependent RNA methyltransferase n=1 Tax=Paenibacillus sp. FSL W8-0426 TaxID=2921714 RepID=UPI0030DB9552
MGKPQLPNAYVQYMRQMLGKEADAFINSYQQPRTHGLRFNSLKATPERLQQVTELFSLTPVPWCESGYYYDENQRPGKHAYHAAGLYYIQEPSAMSAVEMLNPQSGETILDLAAAPGGKTTHIASLIQDRGLLISNEIHPARAKILAENVERMGLASVVVTCAAPGELAARFPATFDRIMLDAPCSGEGMFRKDADAVTDWTEDLVTLCVNRQWDILQDAYTMLKPGGTMAYSTCTFNREENEGMMERLVAAYPDLTLVRKERIWPHLNRGEGHFVAVLTKAEARHANIGESEESMATAKRHGKKGKAGRQNNPGKETQSAWDAFIAWSDEHMPDHVVRTGRPLLFGEALYALPDSGAALLSDERLSGLKLPRAGLHVGDWKKGRFEPAHALALSIAPDAAARMQHVTLEADSDLTAAYLRGESLPADAALKGWTLVTVDGLPLGWGKASGGQLKNRLPKGLRRMQ